jgi:hypothetical protein
MLTVNIRALSQKLCSLYAHGQYPGIESKVMLTLCSRSISGHFLNHKKRKMKDFHFIHISLPVSPLSGIPPEQQRSGKCPTNPGTTPANHGQPG